MKKILLSLLLAYVAWGCSMPMSQERMKDKAYQNIIDAQRCILAGKVDSAHFYQGKANAFYEAAFNEDPIN